MNKKMKELMSQIKTKIEEAKSIEDAEKKLALMDEIEDLQKQYETEERLYEAEKKAGIANATPQTNDNDVDDDSDTNKDDNAKFVKAVKGFIKKGLVEGVDENGGYTVPEDISTKIEHYKDVDYDLGADIDVVPVTTNKGARTFQKKGEVNTFVDIDENGEITEEITAPKFERLPYQIQDRAGFMPVSNDLVADSDANIINVMTECIGKSYVATTNKKVLEKIAEKAQTDLKDLDGIKKALNVTLGQAYKTGAKIYTNDDGLNYLDTLKDGNDRYQLNPDPTAPARLMLRCGTNVLEVKVLPNKVLKTVGGKIPFIVGDLAEYVRKYNRQHYTIKTSDTASIGNFNAFAQNMILMKVVCRDDYRVKDADSIVNGYITAPVGE